MKGKFILLYKEPKEDFWKELYVRDTREELVKKVDKQIADDIEDGLEYEYMIEFRREEGRFSTASKKRRDMFVTTVEGSFIS